MQYAYKANAVIAYCNASSLGFPSGFSKKPRDPSKNPNIRRVAQYLHRKMACLLWLPEGGREEAKKRSMYENHN